MEGPLGLRRILLDIICPFPYPYIGRVPIQWWPQRVRCALWTRHPSVKVAMGCHTEPAIAHIVYIWEKWHNCEQKTELAFAVKKVHHIPKKKLHTFTIFFSGPIFFCTYTTYRKKELHVSTAKKRYMNLRVFGFTFFTRSTSDGSRGTASCRRRHRFGGMRGKFQWLGQGALVKVAITMLYFCKTTQVPGSEVQA